MQPAQIQEFFARLQAANPNPSTELCYSSNFELLLAVMLSAQATDVSVNKATQQLFAVANTATEILNLGENRLKQYIKSIGLYNTKAKNIIKTCHILLTEYQGQVPNQRADLEKLPGVGRKTANVILNTAFGQPTVAVDTHIFRVARRTGLAQGDTVLQIEQQLMQNIPQIYLKNAHHWLILHGRYTCTARKMRCEQCIVQDLCAYG